jgi:hypothetical protein
LPRKLRQVVAGISRGLTIEQSCARAGISADTYHEATKPGTRYAHLRAQAEAGRIEGWMRMLRKIAKGAYTSGDFGTALKAVTWQLEKCYKRQFGEDKGVTIHAQQHNWSLPEERAREIHDREARLLLNVQEKMKEQKERESDGNSENGS